MTYVTVGDIEAEYGPVDTEPTGRVQLLLARAEAQVASAVPDLSTKTTADANYRTLVEQVIAEMVIAVLRNPEGLKSFTRAEGPFSGSQTYAGATTGGVELTRRHRRMLGVSGAFTINPAPQAAPVPFTPSWRDNYRIEWPY